MAGSAGNAGVAGMGGGGTGGSSGSAGSAGTGGGSLCGSLMQLGLPVTELQTNLPFPSTGWMGGPITPGTYTLTAGALYQGSTAMVGSYTQTIVITSTTMALIVSGPNAPPGQYFGMNYTTNGPAITLTLVCGGMGTFNWNYTATSTTLTFYETDSKAVETFTKM